MAYALIYSVLLSPSREIDAQCIFLEEISEYLSRLWLIDVKVFPMENISALPY